MSNWLTNPDVFLYIGHEKYSGLQEWRCVRVSPMQPLLRKDFSEEYLMDTSYEKVISQGNPRIKKGLEELQKYLAPRHFLVNCQGLVYVELHKFGADEKIDQSQRIYLRLLDVLNMESYGFNPPKIPFRTAEYLDDCGAPSMEPSPKEEQLSAELAAKTLENADLRDQLRKERSCRQTADERKVDVEEELRACNSQVNTLKQTLQDVRNAAETKIGALVDANQTLSDKVSELTATLAMHICREAKLQKELNCEKEKTQGLTKRIGDLEEALAAIENDEEVKPWRCEYPMETLDAKVESLECENSSLLDDKSKLTDELASETERTANLVKDLNSVKCINIGLNRKVDQLEAENQAGKDKVVQLTDEVNKQKCKVATLQEDLNKARCENQDLTRKVEDLEEEKNASKNRETTLTVTVSTRTTEVTNLKKVLHAEKCENVELKQRVGSLEDRIKVIREKKRALKVQLEIKKLAGLEPWMNGNASSSNWISFDKLVCRFERTSPALVLTKTGACFTEDGTTNIKAENFYLSFSGEESFPGTMVRIEDLKPNRERAKFDPDVWFKMINGGEVLAFRFPKKD